MGVLIRLIGFKTNLCQSLVEEKGYELGKIWRGRMDEREKVEKQVGCETWNSFRGPNE
jgi:hypothetical protein